MDMVKKHVDLQRKKQIKRNEKQKKIKRLYI